jgi:hypothetical protein
VPDALSVPLVQKEDPAELLPVLLVEGEGEGERQAEED